MPDSQVEDIKSKVDIVSIIGEHVHLTKSGNNFRGLCPFHSEKTPSFMVSEELQIYKCFGCGEGGDVFTFLEKYENVDFPEALKYLADKVGIKLVSNSGIPSSDKDVLYELNSLAAKFYNFLLVSHPVGKIALNYLKEERKIGEDFIKTFNIGFAPANKNVLTSFLTKKKNFKLKDIEKAGLISIKNNIYERFNGRIIFPISNHRGNIIALAGRLLPPGRKDVGKYINSPETPIYHKSSSLYGLNIAKDFIKKEGFAVVVEGEIDLISSFQVGVKNIVAIKGSAFTPDQARLLARYTKAVVLALDSDFAGQNASRKGIKILEEAGFEISVAKLGKFKDPDEAARGNPEFYKEAIKNAVPIWDFIIDSVIAKFDVESASGKEKISKELTPILAEIENKIVQDHYVKKLASLLEVSIEAVEEEVGKTKSSGPNASNIHEETEPNEEKKPRRELLEETLIAMILKERPNLLSDLKILDLIKTQYAKRILEEFGNFAKNGNEINLTNFSKFLPKELFERFSMLVFSINEIEEKEIKSEINKVYAELTASAIKGKMRTVESSKEYSKLQKLLKDFNSAEFERIIT